MSITFLVFIALLGFIGAIGAFFSGLRIQDKQKRENQEAVDNLTVPKTQLVKVENPHKIAFQLPNDINPRELSDFKSTIDLIFVAFLYHVSQNKDWQQRIQILGESQEEAKEQPKASPIIFSDKESTSSQFENRMDKLRTRHESVKILRFITDGKRNGVA